MKLVRSRLAILIFLALFVLGTAYAAYTQHAWEDYWITFRASRNLATGHGFVFEWGERLHTYTSPLGALLPALLSWLTGNQSDQLVLWLFRLVSLGALGGALVLVFQILRKFDLRPVSCFVTVALIGLDAKTIDFSINGMETGLLIFFLALTLHGLLVEGPRQFVRLGLGWAGMMWTRPDSFIYCGILCFSALLFLRDKTRSAGTWKMFLLAGLICIALYLPWFVWAWQYYGSPVPHTIVAKSSNVPHLTFGSAVQNFLLFPLRIFTLQNQIHGKIFGPIYPNFGGWPVAVAFLSAFISGFLSLAWIFPRVSARTRMFSFSFFLGLLYLGEIIRRAAPWYLPPVAVLGWLTFGLLFDEGLTWATQLSRSRGTESALSHFGAVIRTLTFIIIGLQASLLICTAREMAMQQALIENGLRKQIGLWLRDHALSPHDTVMLEPLGYIGYYSQLKMLDYPGLSSREMVDTRRRLGMNKQNLAYLELKPDWLVLRPTELFTQNRMINARRLKEFYEPVAAFDATRKITAVGWLPGRNYLRRDQKFYIFHRKGAGPSASTNVIQLDEPAPSASETNATTNSELP